MGDSGNDELTNSEQARLLDAVTGYAIYMLGPDGTVRSWNRGAESIKGYSASEVIGKDYAMFFRECDRQEGLPTWQLQRALLHGKTEEEGWRVKKNGTTFWAHIVLTPIIGSDGELLGFAKVTKDMTERAKLRELEQTLKGRNTFLAMLGHELRGPLAPIRNAISILQLDRTASPTLTPLIKLLDRQVSHMTKLVDDLLDAGRLTSGKLQLFPEKVYFESVLKVAIECAAPALELKRQNLDLQLPESEISLSADPIRITQVLRNLLSNASKFSPENGTIVVEAHVTNGWVSVTISDSGEGMDPATLNGLFVMFAQGQNQKLSKHGGLGIGLALARSIVEMHGGRISGASKGVGMGSSFTVELPNAMLADQVITSNEQKVAPA